jgi:ABC-type multidrug transport system fused ATPase/permease subunit
MGHRLGADRSAITAMSSAWFLSLLLVGATVLLAIAGTLLVRRLISVEVLERHNEVAGFIYAVIGVVYAVLLGFAAITVWERYDRAQASVAQEANDLADLYRDAETFPSDVRTQLKDQIRDYVRLAVQKEWPAMAVGKSSPEVWDAYIGLWRTYYQLSPRTDQEKTWYSQSLTKLNDLGDQRRIRLLTSRMGSVPVMMWVALLGTGAITIAFSFLFGTPSAAAQIIMSSGLAFTIALVMVAIVALGQPFAGISRVGPQPFEQLEAMFKHLEAPRSP